MIYSGASSAPAGASRHKENAPKEQPFVPLFRPDPKRLLQQGTPAGGGPQAVGAVGKGPEDGLFGMLGEPSGSSSPAPGALPSTSFHTTHGLTAEPSGGFFWHVNQAKALSGQGQTGGHSAGAGLQAVRNMRDLYQPAPLTTADRIQADIAAMGQLKNQGGYFGGIERVDSIGPETPRLGLGGLGSVADATAAQGFQQAPVMAPSTSGVWAPQSRGSVYSQASGYGYNPESSRGVGTDGDDGSFDYDDGNNDRGSFFDNQGNHPFSDGFANYYE